MKYVLDYVCFSIKQAPRRPTNTRIIKSTVYLQSKSTVYLQSIT